MANERVTENIVRAHFREDSFFKENKITIEEQVSANPKIDKLLKNASKNGNGKGFPEFIIQYNDNPDLIIVIECKATITQHNSPDKKQYKDYAVDGVLLYSSFLAKEYDVIAIAVSGNDRQMRVSHFLQLKGHNEAQPIFNDDLLLPIQDYLQGYQTDERKFNQDFQDLLKYSKELNDKLHSLKVKESERSLIISGALIALNDNAFRNSYKLEESPQTLAHSLIEKISQKLSSVQTKHVQDIKTSYSFIKTHTILSKEKNILKELIDEIDEKINGFIKTYKYFDTLGQFYIEFLRYANNDKGLGIVLTPPHITELFCEIASVSKDSVVLDTCTGTGGFLISAMKKMVIDAGGDKDKEKQIKNKQIVGVEIQHDIYSLLCSNMYIHGDGRSNLIKGNCFDNEVKNQIAEFKPNVGFLNPPYKSSKDDIEELEFVINNLEQLAKGSYCIAIIPMSSVIQNNDIIDSLKEKILSKHTLDAVLTMPNELFYNSKASVATCVCVFIAKQKHPNNFKTYFAVWTKDGFIKVKNMGRIDYYNKWEKIKVEILNSYKNKEIIVGHSVKKIVDHTSEWCSEAYIDIDYTDISKKDFEEVVRDYVSNMFYLKNIDKITPASQQDNKNINIKNCHFKFFDLTGDKGIFNIQKGERLNKIYRSLGETPLLTSSSLNNGISAFIDKKSFIYNKKLFKNKITVDMLSNVFYHGYEYFSDDNIHTLSFKEKFASNENCYISMFIVTLLKKISIRYQYGRQVRMKRLSTEKIALPVNKNGVPDWQFMQDYIKSLPYSSNL